MAFEKSPEWIVHNGKEDELPAATKTTVPSPLVFVTHSLSKIIALCCGILLFALFGCLFLSFFVNVSPRTESCCSMWEQIWHMTPTVSGPLQGRRWQRYLWQFCVALVTSPQIVISRSYFNKYRIIFQNSDRTTQYISTVIRHAAYVLQMIQMLSLLALSTFPPAVVYKLHKTSFTWFLLSSYSFMACLLWLQWKSEQNNNNKTQENVSLKIKSVLLGVAVSAFLIAMTLNGTPFQNEKGGLCVFGNPFLGLCEMLIALSFIGYHATGILDFKGCSFVISAQTLEASHPVIAMA